MSGTRKASKRWQQQYTRVFKRFGWRAIALTLGYATTKILAGMCGCHGRHFVAEGSDELVTLLDAIMSTEFEAKLLGRVGRGILPVMKFLKRTLRWHEEEASFRWSGGTRYVEELSQLRGLADDRAATKRKTAGTKATCSSSSPLAVI